MESIKVDKLIKSRRRTISLEIENDGSLIVRAPKYASNRAIQEFIYKKRFWITGKIEYVKSKYGKVVKKEFVNGETFLYLGNPYEMIIDDEAQIPFSLNNSHFVLSGRHVENAREFLIDWYKKKSYEKCSERAAWYSSVSGLEYNKIRITNAEGRWGSCSVKNNLNFTWRLIMAPLPVLDYVVIHELAHTKEKNHSKRFWNTVGSLSPEYKKHIKWLKDNDYLLII